jgi:translation initiation factor IF-1
MGVWEYESVFPCENAKKISAMIMNKLEQMLIKINNGQKIIIG